MSEKTDRQTYKYKKDKSILEGLRDEYELTENEYYKLYSFFVTYSLCENQSRKRKTFTDYGWSNNQLKSTSKDGVVLENILKGIIDLTKSNFVFTDENDLKKQFDSLNLQDAALTDYDNERMVISKTNAGNKYLKLFYRIRNGLAHGKFILKKSSAGEKMFVMQDDDTRNVTARIVVKLSTLLKFVDEIDKSGVLNKSEDINQTKELHEETAA